MSGLAVIVHSPPSKRRFSEQRKLNSEEAASEQPIVMLLENLYVTLLFKDLTNTN
jgi:hypothetical protein